MVFSRKKLQNLVILSRSVLNKKLLQCLLGIKSIINNHSKRIFIFQRNSRIAGEGCPVAEAEAAELQARPGYRPGRRSGGLERVHPHEDQGRRRDRDKGDPR